MFYRPTRPVRESPGFSNGIKIGLLGSLVLFAIYSIVVSLISGPSFAWKQFSEFWYYLIALDAGFGIQLGLYVYIKEKIKTRASASVAASGAASTIAMLSCCTHYAVNLVPVLGATGLLTLISERQVELFWFGIVFNALGIAFMLRRAIKPLTIK